MSRPNSCPTDEVHLRAQSYMNQPELRQMKWVFATNQRMRTTKTPEDAHRPGTELPVHADLASYPEFVRTLFELNSRLARCEEKIEGNVCYLDQMDPKALVNTLPIAEMNYVKRRINLGMVARQSSMMLEIGLNGGHSALLCLMANPNLTLVAVDIFHHKYTEQAAEFLRERFHRRFHCLRGDSRDVLPRMALEQPKNRFDALHIDGGHSEEVAFADVSNSLRVAKLDAFLIFDDMQAPWLANVFEKCLLLGHIYRRTNDDFCSTSMHEVVRVA